jgi:hypothetical protein
MSWGWQFPTLPLGLEIRTSTLVMAALVFGVVSWRTRSPWRGFVAQSAWISAYEILYVGTQVALGEVAPLWWFPASGMLGWVVLAAWMGHRPSRIWIAVFTALWIAWILAGFHANDHGLRPPFSVSQEVLNVATKTALGFAYLSGGWQLRQSSRTAEPAQMRSSPAPLQEPAANVSTKTPVES